MLEKNKKYIIKDVIEELNTGDIVRTNGDCGDTISEYVSYHIVEGMLLKTADPSTFYILNHTISGSGNGIARSYSKEYLYGWCVYSTNDEAWIELVTPKLEPKTLLLNKIKVLTKDTK